MCRRRRVHNDAIVKNRQTTYLDEQLFSNLEVPSLNTSPHVHGMNWVAMAVAWVVRADEQPECQERSQVRGEQGLFGRGNVDPSALYFRGWTQPDIVPSLASCPELNVCAPMDVSLTLEEATSRIRLESRRTCWTTSRRSYEPPRKRREAWVLVGIRNDKRPRQRHRAQDRSQAGFRGIARLRLTPFPHQN